MDRHDFIFRIVVAAMVFTSFIFSVKKCGETNIAANCFRSKKEGTVKDCLPNSDEETLPEILQDHFWEDKS